MLIQISRTCLKVTNEKGNSLGGLPVIPEEWLAGAAGLSGKAKGLDDAENGYKVRQHM